MEDIREFELMPIANFANLFENRRKMDPRNDCVMDVEVRSETAHGAKRALSRSPKSISLLLVASDFNVPSGHQEMRLFRAATGLTSANAENIATFPSWTPKRELDYVLYSEEVTPKSFSVPDVGFSDHLPLVFDFEVEHSDD